MKIRDNRKRESYIEQLITDARVVSIYDWKEGIILCLDTGYEVEIDNSEIDRIKERK